MPFANEIGLIFNKALLILLLRYNSRYIESLVFKNARSAYNYNKRPDRVLQALNIKPCLSSPVPWFVINLVIKMKKKNKTAEIRSCSI